MNDSFPEIDDDSRMQAFDGIVDEITARIRRGDSQDLLDYQTQYPQFTAELAELWPALLMLGNLAPVKTSAETDKANATHFSRSAPPQRLGDFEIIREIGRGGMGVVYAAHQISLDRPVALKILNQQVLPDAQTTARFRREALSAARLQHPHIVPVFGNGEEQGISYYSMRLIDGVSLSSLLEDLRQRDPRRTFDSGSSTSTAPQHELARLLLTQDLQSSSSPARRSSQTTPTDKGRSTKLNATTRTGSGGLSDSQGLGRNYFSNIAKLIRQVAEALHYAHSQQTIHRDIKPSNLILDVEGTIWVTDFGLAKFEYGPNLTQDGDVIGTLKYMAPEQLSGRSAPSCDIYSLGATLYELITLRQPIIANDKVQILDQIRNRDPIRPRDIDSRIPLDLETIALKALSKLPTDRYLSAQDFADDLGRFVEGNPILARPFSGTERLWRWCRRNSIIATLSALLLLVFLIGFSGIWLLWWKAEARAKSESTLRQRAESAESAARQKALAEYTARQQTERALYRSNIIQAQLEYKAHNVAGAQLILADCLVEHRGWEWHYLHQLCQADLATLHGHSSWVYEVTSSADERWIASVGGGNPYWLFQGAESIRPGEICLWNAADGSLVHRLTGHTNLIHCLAFNSNGTLLATAGADQSIKLWDPQTGSLVRTIEGNRSTIRSLAFRPDGKQLASASEDHMIMLWDVESGECTRVLNGHQAWVRRVVYAPDGNTLFSVSTLEDHGPGEVRRWDLQADSPSVVLESSENGLYFDLDIDREGKRLAAASDLGIKIWDLQTGKLQQVLSGHRGVVRSVSFSPDNLSLASGGNDSTVRVWNLDDSKDSMVLQGHLGIVRRVEFSHDGERLFSCSDDETVKIWDALTHPEQANVDVPGYNTDMADVDAIAFTSDGAAVVTARGGWWGDQGVGMVFDAEDFAPLSKTRVGVSGIWMTPACKMSLDAAGERLAGVSLQDRNVARLWDARTGQELKSFPAQRGPLWHVTLSPDGKYLATASWFRLDNTPTADVTIWDVETEIPLLQYTEPHRRVTRFAFSPQAIPPLVAIASVRETRAGQELVSRESDLRLLDLKTGREIKSLSGQSDYLGAVNFDSQGKRLAAAGTDQGTLILYDLETDLTTLSASSPSSAMDLAFTPDGRRVVVAGRLMLKILDATDGQELLILRSSKQAKVNTSGFNPRVRISPDGKKIVAICHDSFESMSLWSIDDDNPSPNSPAVSPTAVPPIDSSDASVRLPKPPEKLARARRRAFAAHLKSCRWHRLPEDLASFQFHSSQASKFQPKNAWQFLYRSFFFLDSGLPEHAQQDWQQAIALTPDNLQLQHDRMLILAERGAWSEAHDCLRQFPQLTRLNSPSDMSLRALLYLHAGDRQGYQDECKRLVETYRSTTDAATRTHLLAVGLASPDSGLDLAELKSLVPQINYQSQDGVTRYLFFLKLLAAYRAKQIDEVQQAIEENKVLDSSGNYRMMDWIVLAMIEAQAGNDAEAEHWRGQAEVKLEVINKETRYFLTTQSRLSLNTRLFLALLLREAEELSKQN